MITYQYEAIFIFLFHFVFCAQEDWVPNNNWPTGATIECMSQSDARGLGVLKDSGSYLAIVWRFLDYSLGCSGTQVVPGILGWMHARLISLTTVLSLV